MPSPSTLPASDPAAIDAAAAALRAGALVVLPTETVYGLACALDDRGLDAVLAAKGRAATKGITLAIASLAQAEAIADLPAAARRLAAAFWPGALTLVVPLAYGVRLPRVLTADTDVVGLRWPDHPVPVALAEVLGPFPLTSANQSGGPDARTAAEAAAALGDRVALVLDGGPARAGTPSTVVRCDRSGAAEVLREGAIERHEIQRVARG